MIKYNWEGIGQLFQFQTTLCMDSVHLSDTSVITLPVRNYLSKENFVWFKILDGSFHKGEEGRAEKFTPWTNREGRNKTKQDKPLPPRHTLYDYFLQLDATSTFVHT